MCFTWRAAYFTSLCNFVRRCSRKWLPVPLPTQHPTYATIVAASLAQCTTVASRKENVILPKNNSSITRPPPGRAPLTPLPRNAHDFRPVYCPYFCYWPAVARHLGFQPLSPPSLAARSTCATKEVTRWFSRWWSGSIVSTPTPKVAVVLFVQSTYKKLSVLWRSPLLLQIN